MRWLLRGRSICSTWSNSVDLPFLCVYDQASIRRKYEEEVEIIKASAIKRLEEAKKARTRLYEERTEQLHVRHHSILVPSPLEKNRST